MTDRTEIPMLPERKTLNGKFDAHCHVCWNPVYTLWIDDRDPCGKCHFGYTDLSIVPLPRDIRPYDNYEINPCTRTPGEIEGYFTVEVCEPDEADFWTLYGHLPEGGVEAIGDFATREAAEQTFQRITGIPFGSHEEIAAHLRVMHAGPKLLEALEAIIPYAESEAESLAECHRREGGLELQPHVEACERKLAAARAAMSAATGKGAGGSPPVETTPSPLEALHLASAYVQYVKERNPELHAEADGTPSIEAAIQVAIAGRAA